MAPTFVFDICGFFQRGIANPQNVGCASVAPKLASSARPRRENVLSIGDAKAHLALGHQFAVAEDGAAQLAKLRFHPDHFSFHAYGITGLNRLNNTRGGYMQDHRDLAGHLRALQHQHGADLRDQFQNNAGRDERDAGGIPARGLIVDGKMLYRYDALPGNKFGNLIYKEEGEAVGKDANDIVRGEVSHLT